jgi:hypothetical protein
MLNDGKDGPMVHSAVAEMAFRMDLCTLLPQIDMLYFFHQKGRGFASQASAKAMMSAMKGSTKKIVLYVKIKGPFLQLSDGAKLAE